MVTCANCSAPNRDEDEKCYACHKSLAGSQPVSTGKLSKGDKAAAAKATAAKAGAVKPTSKSASDFPTLAMPVAIGLMVASALVSFVLCYLIFVMPLSGQVEELQTAVSKARSDARNAGNNVSTPGVSSAPGRMGGGRPAPQAPGAAATDGSSY